MVLAEVRRACLDRLRSPVLWVLYAIAFLLWLVAPLYEWSTQVHPLPLKVVLLEIPSALLFFFCFVWLSPVAWQWDGRSGDPPVTPGRVLLALGICLAMLFLNLQVLSWIMQAGGFPPLGPEVLLGNLSGEGPGLFLVGYLLAAQEKVESERAESQRRAEEARTGQLQGQVQPHVLFNALNGLAELVEQDPERGAAALRAMSGFMHGVMEATGHAGWSLGEERRLVEDFLTMEAMRLGDRLRTRWDWSHALDRHAVPPLCLQPLIENALKHGIRPAAGGGELEVAGWMEGPALVVEVRNTGTGDAGDASGERTGLGLANLRARLQLACPNGSSVELFHEEGWTVSRIRLDPAPEALP